MPYPNLVRDPGAELDDPGWTFEGVQSGRVDDSSIAPHSGVWSFGVAGTRTGPPFPSVDSGALYRLDLVLAKGHPYTFTVWLNPNNAGIANLFIDFDVGSGYVEYANIPTSSLPAATWTQRTIASSIVATGGVGAIRFRCPAPGTPGGGLWLIDDIIVSDPTVIEGTITMPENTPGPVRFERGQLDEFYGTLHKEGGVLRDRRGRVRRADDLDEPDREELKSRWGVPRARRTYNP